MSKLRDALYAGERFVVRLGRIVGGLVIAVIALWCGVEAFEVLSKPLASASLLSIAGGLFLAYLTFVFISLASGAAFGEAPSRSEVEARRRSECVSLEAQQREQAERKQIRCETSLNVNRYNRWFELGRRFRAILERRQGR
jgi:hypothetical protein